MWPDRQRDLSEECDSEPGWGANGEYHSENGGELCRGQVRGGGNNIHDASHILYSECNHCLWVFLGATLKWKIGSGDPMTVPDGPRKKDSSISIQYNSIEVILKNTLVSVFMSLKIGFF